MGPDSPIFPITLLDSVGSTNDEALAAGRAGAPHGWTVAARAPAIASIVRSIRSFRAAVSTLIRTPSGICPSPMSRRTNSNSSVEAAG